MGDTIDLSCLKLGPGYILHMPGELFIEYQLAAQKMRPNAPVCMAAYGDYGAGGNVTAGKYNDGSKPRRGELAERLAVGMKKAWDNTKKTPVTAANVEWRTVQVALPPSPGLDEAALLKVVDDSAAKPVDRVRAARNLVWLRRAQMGDKIELSCLKLGPGYILNMPGELFIEYQLAAQKMRPDAPVCMAAYGDYGPGYIGTEIAYTQGGYETGPVSRVAPEVERVLMKGMKELLK
jgi:hypothetical protein